MPFTLWIWNVGRALAMTNLRGAYLRGADLSGADLSGAYLSGADLRGAYLSGANLSGANLRAADLRRADLSEAYLRRADLRGANLREAYLSGAELSKADLRGAYLSGANLSRANLRWADLSGANLNWNSHDLISAVLYAASDRNTHRALAGFVLVSRNLCWREFLAIDDLEGADWAIGILLSQKNPPDKLKYARKRRKKNQLQHSEESEDRCAESGKKSVDKR